MKKVIAVLSALAIVFSFSACGANGGKETTVAVNNDTSVNEASQAGADNDTTVLQDDTVASETVTDKSGETVKATTKKGETTKKVSKSTTKKTTVKTTAKKTTTKKVTVSAKKPSTVAEIVKCYNFAVNSAKTSSKSIRQNYQKNSSNGFKLVGALKSISGLANKLVNGNMGDIKDRTGKTYTSQSDKNKYFPVEEKSYGSKLTAGNVKSASCSESNGTYVITIVLKNDLSSVSSAMAPITKQAIVDGAGKAGMAVIKEDSIKVTYSNCTIKATVDSKTGHLKSLYHKLPWNLALTALGNNVSLGVTIEQDYTINW